MNQSVQIFIYQLINENPDMSRFSISHCEKKIRTCPDFYLSIEYLKSGLVQISYLDVSRFEIFDGKFWIWTCPNFNFGHVQIFFFQLKIWNLDLSRYQFWTSDSHVGKTAVWPEYATVTFFYHQYKILIL